MSFTPLQQGTRQTGTGSVALVLPNNASSQNTLLLAVLFSGAGNTFTAPAAPQAGTGWQFGRRITIAGVNIELWHMVNNIGGLYFAAGATFTATGSCAGFMLEFASPANTTQVLDTVGVATGAGLGAAMPVSTAAGCFNGSLGILVPLQTFSASVTGQANQWVVPSGFTRSTQISNGVADFYTLMYNGNLTTAGAVAGNQSASPGYNYTGTPTPTGWGVIYAVYRSTAVTTIHVDGGEPTNCLDLDPSGQMLFVGGDVEGCWRSADYGQNWQRACYGFNGPDEVSFADVKWSLTQPGYLYAMTGKAARAGGFCASADGGCTWTLLNSQVSYYGNATPSNPRPSTENQDTDRGVGQSLAQDAVNGLLYTVTGNLGVCRSADNGNTWTPIGPAGFWNVKTMFPRCIIINPSNPAQVFVGMWDIGNGNGGIFMTTNANASSATSVVWTQIVGSGIVGQLKLLGNFVYAAYHSGGVFRYGLTDGSWTSLNGATGGPVDTTGTSLWLTIDGFIDGSGNHNLFAGCSNGLPRSGASKPNYTNVIWLQCPGGNLPATYTDLTGAANINLATIPPYNNAWWHFGASWQFWLGGNDSVNPHILVDPHTTGNVNGPTLYLCNSGGWFICTNPFATPATAITWQLSVSGMEVAGNHGFAIDPNMGSHFVSRGSDYTSIDVGYNATGPGDPTGGTPSQVVATGPGASLSGHHRESHALCFDPADSRVYVGLNTAYSQADGGAVMYRAASPNSTWHSTSYDTKVPTVTGTTAPAVIGMAAGTIGGARWAIAIAQGSGPWYWNGTSWAKGQMVPGDNSPLPGSSPNVPGQHADMAVGSSGYVYCYDRKNGLYRSTDQGQTWQQIWGVPTSDDRTGWIAINPSPPSGKTELWAGTDSGLYQLVGVGSGIAGQSGGAVVTQYGAGTVFQAGAAGVTFTPSGAVMAIALQGTAGIEPPVNTIYISYNNGATWADWTGGDSSAGSYMPPAGQLGMSISGWLWAAGGENFGLWGQFPVANGTASLSGQGQLTALSSNLVGRAPLSGQGNLIAGQTVAQTAFLSGTGTLTAAGTRSGPFAGVATLNGVGNLSAVAGLITSASIIPSYLPEQPVLTVDMNDWFTWDITYKVFATNRPGTTTLAPDPDLVLPVLPGASYEIRMVIFYDGAGNLAFNWAYPADAVMNMSAWYNDSSGNISDHASAGTASHTAKTASDLTTEVVIVNASLQAGLTVGTLAFQWAQSSSNSTALVVEPNSLMMMRRIA